VRAKQKGSTADSAMKLNIILNPEGRTMESVQPRTSVRHLRMYIDLPS